MMPLAPQSLLDRLVGSSQRNLRRALLSLEACKAQQYPFSDSQEVPAPDWELYVQVGQWEQYSRRCRTCALGLGDAYVHLR